MEPETLIDRGEVSGMLFGLADLNDNVRKILVILQEEFGGEVQEDDS